MSRPLTGQLLGRIRRARKRARERSPICLRCGKEHLPIRRIMEPGGGYVSRTDPTRRSQGHIENLDDAGNTFFYRWLLWSANRHRGRFDEKNEMPYCKCRACGCRRIWKEFVQLSDEVQRDCRREKEKERASKEKREKQEAAVAEEERQCAALPRANELRMAAERAKRKSAVHKPEPAKQAEEFSGNRAWANDPVYKFPPKPPTWRWGSIDKELSL